MERDIEEARKKLALRSDFNLLDGFRLFDRKGRGYITSSELEKALANLGIFPTRDELYLLFRRYDKDSDGLVRFSDFSKMMNPTSSEYSNLLKERSPVYIESEDDFSLETRRCLKSLLKMSINGETNAESLR